MRWICVFLLLAGCATTDRPAEPRGHLQQRSDDWWANAVNQPVPPGNVRITIDRFEIDRRDTEAYGAMIGYRSDHARVKIGGPSSKHGLRVFAVKDGFHGAISASRSGRTHRSSSQSWLLLVPGATGQLQVTEHRGRPYIVVIPTYHGPAIAAGSRYEVTGSSFQVTVIEARDGLVTLELTPYFHAARRGKHIVVNELATRIVVPENQPVVIMADRSDTSNTATQLLSYRSKSVEREIIIAITAQVGR